MFRLPLLSNGRADCVEIWYALGDPLVTAYAVVTGVVSELRDVKEAKSSALCRRRAAAWLMARNVK